MSYKYVLPIVILLASLLFSVLFLHKSVDKLVVSQQELIQLKLEANKIDRANSEKIISMDEKLEEVLELMKRKGDSYGAQSN